MPNAWNKASVPLRWCIAAIALLCAACSGTGPDWGEPAPALFEVTSPGGSTGYLFGTIHALPDGVKWRTRVMDDAFARSDSLMVEVADLDDAAAMRSAFDEMARTTGQPPLPARLPPEDAARARDLMNGASLDDEDFADMESWAAALTLAGIERYGRSENGADRILLRNARGTKRIIELEGARAQLALFDGLPEHSQRHLLTETVRNAGNDARAEANARAWFKGDLAFLEAALQESALADPVLQKTLVTDRNRAWAARIDRVMRAGALPFIAVGAGHLTGPNSLTAQLERRGYTVRRIQ